jgi:mycothiol synthase
MAVELRQFREEDVGLLQESVAHWIATAGTCGYCHPGGIVHRLSQLRVGQYPLGDLVQIWEDAGTPIAVALNFRFETAFDLFLAPAYRGSSIEYQLLAHAATTTQRYVDMLKQAEAVVTSDVYRCDTARQTLLAQLGFHEYRTWDWVTERSLTHALPSVELPAGFRIRHAAITDYQELVAAENDAFQGAVSAESYREQVMQKPGYLPEDVLVVVHETQQIVAFTHIWFDGHNRVGLFEPVGTCRAFQRRGLARALLLYGMEYMISKGMLSARIEHDASNQPALALYRELGFVRLYETCGYQKGR